MNNTDLNILKKLPASIQAIFGFALVAVGINVMLNATMISNMVMENPQLVVQYLFFLIGVLYLIGGVPSLIEGVMTMNAQKEQQKLLEMEIKKRG
jgi:hypothetical protein